ncbi:MAG TPA: hypothetical protein VMA09_15295 [Candidatus Binataceae bacterium]|nr:hypothetical protein [Candidatus Binataceae bacterium]
MRYTKITLCMVVAAAAIAMLCRASAHAGGFSNRSIKGSYASTFQGSVIDGTSLLPINGTAVITADGKGNISGHESFVFNGTICTNVSSKGIYRVNADGSGTASFVFTGSSLACSGTYTQSLATAESGAIVVLNNTNADNQISEIWRQQNSSPF